MAVYQTAELTGTVVGVRTGATLLRKIKVKATVFDSPVLYIQIWNTASGSVTIGTTAPIMVLQVPAGDAVTPLKEQTFIFVGPKGCCLVPLSALPVPLHTMAARLPMQATDRM
jgi:hypothetical protein